MYRTGLDSLILTMISLELRMTPTPPVKSVPDCLLESLTLALIFVYITFDALGCESTFNLMGNSSY